MNDGVQNGGPFGMAVLRNGENVTSSVEVNDMNELLSFKFTTYFFIVRSKDRTYNVNTEQMYLLQIRNFGVTCHEDAVDQND